MQPFSIERLQWLGFSGVALLVVGCFSPLFQLPIVGSISFVAAGQGDGIFVLALVLIAGVLLSIRAYTWVFAPACGATVICAFTLTTFFGALSDARTQLAGSMKDNPFAGLVAALAQSVSLEWGWGLLLLGLLCLFVSAGATFRLRADGAASPTTLPRIATIQAVSSLSQPAETIFRDFEGLSTSPVRRSSFGQRRS